MKTIHWIEKKQLDRVTNFSPRTECIRNILNAGHEIYYYCTFAKSKVYYGLNNNIIYLGHFKNKYVKYFEWPLAVIIKSLQIILNNRRDIIMVNQDLVKLMFPAVWLNKILKKGNKFILDIRTLPTDTAGHASKMRKYYSLMKVAIHNFDGLSFITPFMEKVSLQPFNCELPTVNWSSGVDVELFDATKFDYTRDSDCFRIFYHGGISKSRGNLDLIMACEHVVERGYNIELIQIGKIVDDSLEEYIEKKQISSWCKLYNACPLSEIPAMVAKCDLPVLPFPDFLPWRVSSPIKLMEYLAMGKPVLVPEMECFTDVLQPNSGMVYYYPILKDNQIEIITNAIIDRIEHRTYGLSYPKENCCISHAKEYYTWETQAHKLMHFCLRLVES